MKFALAQINPVSGDVWGNVRHMEKTMDEARMSEADVVIFPEMSIPGYCIADLMDNTRFLEANMEAIGELKKFTENMAAVVGYVEIDNGRKYNSAAVLNNCELKGNARKTLLPSYRYFDDKRYFSPGKNQNPVEIEIGNEKAKLGISICEDMWDYGYEKKPICNLASGGADIIININASPFTPGKKFARSREIRRHVENTKLPFAYVNTVGVADNGKNIIPFDGQSMVYDSICGLSAIGKQFEEDIVYFDFTPKKRHIPRKLVCNNINDGEREIHDAIVMSLRDYAKKSGFSRAIESVSGGIDSCLGVALCAESFGSENVTAFSMPTRYNSDTTRNIAKRVCENLGIKFKEIPIDENYRNMENSFEKNNHKIEKNITKENMQSRIRGMIMMAESNDTGALLVSNGNKTELALGYATLYGDMCGGISVIGDLSKSDVYRIAKYVNRRAGKEIIPKEAFEIVPSAELAHGQKDPFDYIAVSPIVDEFVECRRDPNELKELFAIRNLDEERFEKYPDGRSIYEKYDNESFGNLIDKTYEQFRKSVFKRIQAPPIIAVSERALGYDLRETLINGWKQ